MKTATERSWAAPRSPLPMVAWLAVLVLVGAMVSTEMAWAQAGPAAPDAAAASGTPTTGAPFDKATFKQKQKATRAYQAGTRLMAAKKYEQALAKFRESYGTVASPNSRLMVVRALAEAGKHVEAYEEAVALMPEAEAAAAKSRKYKKTAAAARDELAAAKAAVGLLTVNVGGATEGATLTIAGQQIDEAKWGSELALEPGDIEVVLKTPAGEQTETVSLVAGSPQSIDIAPPVAEKTDEGGDGQQPEDEGGDYRGPDRRLMAIIAGGVGVLGFTGFTIFGLMSNAKLSNLEDNCTATGECAIKYASDASDGRTFQTVANVSLVVSIIGIAAGAGLLTWDLLDPAAEQPEGDTARRASLTLGPGSAMLSGSF